MLSERVIGKKAWVTGAAHGIGRASAWALAEAGADVAISDINEKGLEETAEYIRKLGRKALILPADITKENEIEETINTIVDKWGKLDIAYCNAGTFQDIPAEDITLNQVCYNMKAQYVADYGLISAAIIILVLPVIVLFVVFQKQVIKGMTAGSVKG